jgi:hypothetical protein
MQNEPTGCPVPTEAAVEGRRWIDEKRIDARGLRAPRRLAVAALLSRDASGGHRVFDDSVLSGSQASVPAGPVLLSPK